MKDTKKVLKSNDNDLSYIRGISIIAAIASIILFVLMILDKPESLGAMCRIAMLGLFIICQALIIYQTIKEQVKDVNVCKVCSTKIDKAFSYCPVCGSAVTGEVKSFNDKELIKDDLTQLKDAVTSVEMPDYDEIDLSKVKDEEFSDMEEDNLDEFFE